MLIFSVLIRYATKNIRKNIIYRIININININKVKSLYMNVSGILIDKFLFTIDKLNMIYLRLFAKINK